MAGQFPSMGGGGISQSPSGFIMQQQQANPASAGGFGGTAPPAGFQTGSDLGSFSGSGGGFSSFPISTMASFGSQQSAGGFPAPPAYTQSGGSASYSPAAVSYNGLGNAAYGAQSPVYAQSPAAGRPQLAASPVASGFPAGPGAYQHMQQPSRFQQSAFQQQQQQQQQQQPGFTGSMQGFASPGPQQQQQFGQLQQQQLQAQYGQLQQQQQAGLTFQQQQQSTASVQMMSSAGAAGMSQLAGAPTPPQQQQQQQQQPQQQQVPQHQPAAQQQAGAVAPQQQPPPQQQREYNVATVCRYGQEYLLDLVTRSQDLFNILKLHQPPNGTAQGANISADKQNKIKQHLECIRMLFRRLRIVHDRIAESCAGLEFTPIESMIPYKDEPDTKLEEKKNSELYRKALEEYNETKEQVQQRSRYLKEIIDQLRNIVWDVNTMLAMRCTN